MAIAGAAIGAAGSLIAGGLNYLGQKSANKHNVASAREAMQFSHDEYGTQYQRSMEDMRKAGLNPILAAKFGGGGAPSGVTSQSQNEFSGAVSSATEAKRLAADIELIKENAMLSRINQRAVLADIANKNLATASTVRLQNAQGDNYDSSTLLNAQNAKSIAAAMSKNAATSPFYDSLHKVARDSSGFFNSAYDELTANVAGGLRDTGAFLGKKKAAVGKFFSSKSSKHFKR